MSAIADSDFPSLLIISCSRRKRSDCGLLSALDRYDGSVFRLLRRFLKLHSPTHLDILILSAKYGLITPEFAIANYDRQMTKTRAKALQSQVAGKLTAVLRSRSYQQIFLCLGKTYLQALEGCDAIANPEIKVQMARGGMGEKLAELYRWLYGKSAPPRASGQYRGRACLRGVEIILTPEEVVEKARMAISSGDTRCDRYQSWYVEVGDRRVSSKWLVHLLTGIPVNTFTAGESRRVLNQLGICVNKVENMV